MLSLLIIGLLILLLLILILTVYGFNPLIPLDILSLPSNEYANFDGKKKVDSIKEFHVKVGTNIEKKNVQGLVCYTCRQINAYIYPVF